MIRRLRILFVRLGGGINYIAVCQTLEASSPAIAAGLCVDNIFALIYFPALSALASGRPDVEESGCSTNVEEGTKDSFDVESVSHCLSVAAIMISLGIKMGGRSSALPVATLLSIVFATFAPQKFIKKLRPTSEVLGTCLLYLFFATAGAPGLAIADSVRASFIPLSLFLLSLYGFHTFFIEMCRRIFRRSFKASMLPQRLLCASSASIGGPATAAALASSNGWNSLVAPSLLVGNLGYAIATFIGILFHALSRQGLT